jgi:hypothetical protein
VKKCFNHNKLTKFLTALKSAIGNLSSVGHFIGLRQSSHPADVGKRQPLPVQNYVSALNGKREAHVTTATGNLQPSQHKVQAKTFSSEASWASHQQPSVMLPSPNQESAVIRQTQRPQTEQRTSKMNRANSVVTKKHKTGNYTVFAFSLIYFSRQVFAELVLAVVSIIIIVVVS